MNLTLTQEMIDTLSKEESEFFMLITKECLDNEAAASRLNLTEEEFSKLEDRTWRKLSYLMVEVAKKRGEF